MRYKPNLTQKIAQGFTLIGIGLVCQWPVQFRYMLTLVSTCLVVFSLIACFQAIRFEKTAEIPSIFFPQLWLSLFKAQSFLLLTTLIVIGTFCYHTQANTRLQGLDLSNVISLLKQEYCFLVVVPWSLYLTIGIGMSYLIKLGKPAFLAGMIYPMQRNAWQLFLYRYCQFCNQASNVWAIVCFASCILLLLSDGLSRQMYFPPLSAVPIRTAIFSFVCLWLGNKWIKKLFQVFIKRYQVSLGLLLSVYIIILAFFLVWLHEFSIVTVGSGFVVNTKSALVGMFTPLVRDNRLSILIMGWWLVWLPLMSSWIAKWVLKSSIWKVVAAFVVFPGVFFPGILFWLPIEQWQVMSAQFAIPGWQIFYAGIGLAILTITLRKVRSLQQLIQGWLDITDPMFDRPLLKLSLPMVTKLVLFSAGLFAFGWVIAHVILGAIAFYFLLVIALFVWTVWKNSSSSRHNANHKLLKN